MFAYFWVIDRNVWDSTTLHSLVLNENGEKFYGGTFGHHQNADFLFYITVLVEERHQ